MDEDILKKLAELETKVDAVYKSSEQTRKYFLWTIIGSAVVLVLPLIGLLFYYSHISKLFGRESRFA